MPTTLDRRDVLRASTAAALAALLARPAIHAAQATPVATPGAAVPQPADPVAANTAFALDLLHALRDQFPANVLFSPLSITLALGMTLAGARGDTADQIATTLGFTTVGSDIHEALGELSADLRLRGNSGLLGDGNRGLRIANALWGEQSYAFDDAFLDLLEDTCGASLTPTDFINAPEAARDEINAWVADQTEDRITNIVPPGLITALTRLVLANAIWFSGAWADQFDPDRTADDTFHLPDGSAIDVPFMTQQLTLPYAARDGFQAVEIPYADSAFRMTILLPDDDLAAIEDVLDPNALAAALDALEWTDVVLHLPRFEFETAIGLAGTLAALGMPDAFDPDRADFSGMVPATPDPPLVISDVLHKAFITVDEDGTEAAAATVVIIEATGAQPDPQEPLDLRVDRPCLFAIRDADTGALLFLGRLTDPRG